MQSRKERVAAPVELVAERLRRRVVPVAEHRESGFVRTQMSVEMFRRRRFHVRSVPLGGLHEAFVPAPTVRDSFLASNVASGTLNYVSVSDWATRSAQLAQYG